MTEIVEWPLGLNQPGFKYPAEYFRAEHHDATGGGNGVGDPHALKVSAQPAPDGTIHVAPGGATLKSVYPGQEGQSYFTPFFRPKTILVPPTGSSSGGRTDLVVVEVCDPQWGQHWDYSGTYPYPREVAETLDFQRVRVLTGHDRTSTLDFPHALLAEISRPANTTIVTNSHITDLRELANPKTLVVPLVKNIGHDTHTAGRTGNYNTLAEFSVDVPDWATTTVVDGVLAGAFVRHPNGGVTGNFDFDGLGSFVGGSRGDWQQTGWSAPGSVAWERLDFHAGGEVLIDPERRGTTQRVRLRVRIPTSAPAGSEAGTEPQSLAKLNVTFQQGVL